MSVSSWTLRDGTAKWQGTEVSGRQVDCEPKKNRFVSKRMEEIKEQRQIQVELFVNAFEKKDSANVDNI